MTIANLTKRIPSLDAFRGFTIASMILVSHPGSWDYIFPQLDHAKWHGLTFTDLVAPFFLWVVGVSITIALTKRLNTGIKREQILLHILKRSILLFAIGVFCNGFPYGLIGNHFFHWDTIRIMGILQRIAICYFFASLIFLYTSKTFQILLTLLLIIGSWIALKTIPVPNFGAGVLEPMGNLAWYIDSHLLHGHTYAGSPAPGFDPEGIFGTFVALATSLIGVVSGHLLNSNKNDYQKIGWMLLAGAILTILGLIMHEFLPLNKNLWTSSFALFTGGVALLGYALFYYLIEVKNQNKLFKPLEIFGYNALTIFVISLIINKLIFNIKIADNTGSLISFKNYYFNHLFLPIGDPKLASLLHAILAVLFIYLIAYILYRTKKIIKV
jgi:predicted acyltransferase